MDVGRLTARLPPGADAFRTAIWLLDRGLWPVPISAPDDPRSSSPGKAPLGKEWGRKRPTVEGLRATYRWYSQAGIGVLLGPRAHVVDLEVDDAERARAVLDRIFPAGMPQTLGWRSTRGEHRLFLWEPRLRELATTAVITLAHAAVELRVGGPGKQVASVCPPSLGTDGRPREWNGVWKIAPFPAELVAELGQLDAERRARIPSPTPTPFPRPGSVDRYAHAALAREVELVRHAESGTRNHTLNRAAFSLGQLVSSGAIGQDEVESALRAAAIEAGLNEREIASTLRSGLEAGLRHPRGTSREENRNVG